MQSLQALAIACIVFATMQLHSFRTGSELIARAGEFLLAHEITNSFVLGIATRETNTSPDPARQPFFATVEQDGCVLGVTVRTPPHQLLLSYVEANAIARVAQCVSDHLHALGIALPGVAGPSGVADVFAEHWARTTGVSTRVHMALREFELSRVVPPAIVPGEMVVATAGELGLVHEWIHAFIDETGLPRADRDFATRELVAGRIEQRRFWFWQDGGGPRCIAGTGGTARVARIGPVYTPPTQRGRGYASALVAARSQSLLGGGCWRVTLSTDLANPTSNRIYQALGYQPIGDSVMIAFDG